jgi:ABC-type thiamin/hydroxymethylpyrimidine transport system permease subunit
MRKNWQIGELLLLLVLSVPVVFGLAYLLWPVSPRLAIAAEFISFLTIIVAWFKLLDNFVSHA